LDLDNCILYVSGGGGDIGYNGKSNKTRKDKVVAVLA
jgi:hypothetical protein